MPRPLSAVSHLCLGALGFMQPIEPACPFQRTQHGGKCWPCSSVILETSHQVRRTAISSSINGHKRTHSLRVLGERGCSPLSHPRVVGSTPVQVPDSHNCLLGNGEPTASVVEGWVREKRAKSIRVISPQPDQAAINSGWARAQLCQAQTLAGGRHPMHSLGLKLPWPILASWWLHLGG